MNPLYRNWKDPIPFDQLDVDHVTDAAERVEADCLKIKQSILDSPVDDKQGRLIQMDELEGHLDFVLSPLYLLKDVHPDDDVRNACHEATERLLNFDTKMDYDEDLYHSLTAFSATNPDLSPVEYRYMKQRLDNFERNGLKLGKQERARLNELDERINQVELSFTKNISESEKTLFFPEADLKGLPSDYLADRRQEDGTIKVTTQYPDFVPFMRYVDNEAARQKLYEEFNTRAKDVNLKVLRDMLMLRKDRTELLGFDTFAAYNLDDKMARNAETVWSFLGNVRNKVAEKALLDYKKLCDEYGSSTLAAWNKNYATTKYKAAHFQLSEEEVKPYFPLDGALQGVFDICETLFSLRFEKKNLPSWHEEVITYEVFEGDRFVGRFYLDMYPRANKYGHAACFGVQSGRQGLDGYQHPAVALVCNFAKPTASKPCLLSHGDVETLFHEFGHLLHQMLSTAPFYRLSGTSVARDFVEMPSQMMEEWAWEKSILKKFARHYKTGEPIPDVLVDKMLAVRQLNSAIDTQQQLLYSSLDLKYHDGYQPSDDENDTTRIFHELVKEHTLFETNQSSCMQASFGHLVGYAAGYYGYMWSKVYAVDMFSVFKEGGVSNPDVGHRFRDIILAKGDTEDPMELIKQFLGREPNIDAFLASIGV